MLTIYPPRELEAQLQTEAQKRGVVAEESAIQALRVFLQSDGARTRHAMNLNINISLVRTPINVRSERGNIAVI